MCPTMSSPRNATSDTTTLREARSWSTSFAFRARAERLLVHTANCRLVAKGRSARISIMDGPTL